MNQYYTYKCWAHNDLESAETNSEFLTARSAREAAEIFAEKFRTMNVSVKEANNHYAKTFCYLVDVDLKPVFKAKLIEEKEYTPSKIYYSGEF